MYVSSDAAAAYEAITPDADGAGAPFPVGGTVVRAAYDDKGALAALAVMVKRERGYFADVGDFFFGVTDVDGEPQSDEHGLLWGKVSECAECHEGRATSGYFFGVARADR
jgi:hypothetical protein